MDFVEICNVYIGKMTIKAAKRIFNSDKICRSYSNLNFGVTFFGTQCRPILNSAKARLQRISLLDLGADSVRQVNGLWSLSVNGYF